MIRQLALTAAFALITAACGQKPDYDAGAAMHGVACYSCHGDRYHDPTTAPDHEGASFATTCADCHATTSWSPATFTDHDRHWPLTGRHTEVGCTSCHIGDVYAGTPRHCAGCHTPEFEATDDPDHLAAGYPKTCEVCHTTAAWTPAELSGHDEHWPLQGAHLEATCAQCHEGGVYAGTPRDCAGCHTPDFEATTEPDHEVGGYPNTCETCHSVVAWRPATFDEHDQYWPLQGAHAEATCATCHEGGVYQGTPRDCAGCHTPDYEATVDPDHETEGYPTTCETCHSVVAWKPATFEGHDDFWPLKGHHLDATCADCHEGGVYEGTPGQCEDCHLPDYQAAINPQHAAPLTPTTCADCHTETDWAPAPLPTHDIVFLVSSGDHKEYQCADCHTDAAAWSRYTCTGCHDNEHTLSRMNAEHSDVGDYGSTLASFPTPDQGCLDCHPRGLKQED